jgi:hypothetical protein
MIEDGGSLKSFRLVCKPAQNESPRTTDTFGIGILLVHSATECGDEIVQLFLSAHDPPSVDSLWHDWSQLRPELRCLPSYL